MLNMGLTPEQQELKLQVRAWVEQHIVPVAKHYDETGEFPLPIIEEAAKFGLLKSIVPKEYGGPGRDSLSMAVIIEEICRGCGAMGTTIGGNGLSSYPIFIAANEEQKRRWFQHLLNGELGAFALTEAGAGSDAGAVATTAILDGDEYILNGSKCFITTGGYAGIYIVIASTNPSQGTKGLSAFIVEGGSKGLTTGKKEDKMGIRSSNTVELLLNDVRIPKENLLGKEGDGFRICMKTLDSGRIAVAAQAVGVAQAAYEAALDYVKNQLRSGKPLARSQYYQFKVADMAIAVESARNSVYKACYLKESGQSFGKEAAIAKTLCTDTAMQVVAQAVELLGIYGYLKEGPVEKLMRDIKVMQLYEGTNQVQRIVIANTILNA